MIALQKLLSVAFKVQPHYLIAQYFIQPSIKVQWIAGPQIHFRGSLTFCIHRMVYLTFSFDKSYFSYKSYLDITSSVKSSPVFPLYPGKSPISSNKLWLKHISCAVTELIIYVFISPTGLRALMGETGLSIIIYSWYVVST